MTVLLKEQKVVDGLTLKPIKPVLPQRIAYNQVVARFKPLELGVPFTGEPPKATYDDPVEYHSFDTNIRLIGNESVTYSHDELYNLQNYVTNKLNVQLSNLWYQGTDNAVTLRNLANSTSYSSNSTLWINDVSTATSNYTNAYRINVVVDADQYAALQKRSKLDQMRHKIRSNLLIKVKHRGAHQGSNHSPAELKARDTLRDLLLESEWRRYITNGFIMVKGRSGLWYQIFNPTTGRRVQVYKNNRPIESICIHTDSTCPPTDHVINLKVLVEYDEDAIRSGGNIHPILVPSAWAS
jgi:hypothetical protein